MNELATLLDEEFQGDWTGERVVWFLKAHLDVTLTSLGGATWDAYPEYDGMVWAFD